MAKIIKELTLDVVRDNIGSTVTAKQNDIDSRFIKARITADRRALELNPVSTVVINALRSDGESSGFLGKVNTDGTVSVPITSWMLCVSGTVKCDISVFDGTEKLTTMPFFISVEESLYDGAGIENEEDYGILSTLMGEIQNIRVEENSRVSAEALRAQAEEERAFAENERESAEALRETNEAARAAAEGKRTTFIPSVSEAGVISWTNDKGLENPAPVSIKGNDGYTPVKGTDYWTESDKAEIINGVLNALPYAEEGTF